MNTIVQPHGTRSALTLEILAEELRVELSNCRTGGSATD